MGPLKFTLCSHEINSTNTLCAIPRNGLETHRGDFPDSISCVFVLLADACPRVKNLPTRGALTLHSLLFEPIAVQSGRVCNREVYARSGLSWCCTLSDNK